MVSNTGRLHYISAISEVEVPDTIISPIISADIGAKNCQYDWNGRYWRSILPILILISILRF